MRPSRGVGPDFSASLCLRSLAQEEKVDDKDVVVVTEANFDEIVPDKDLILVEFYAPCEESRMSACSALIFLLGQGAVTASPLPPSTPRLPLLC